MIKSRKMLTKSCVICRNKFIVDRPFRYKMAKFCSHTCYGISERGKIPKSAFKKGHHPSPKTEFKKGKLHRYFGKSSPALGKHWKRPLEATIKTADKLRGKPRLSHRGENHHNWQGGITPLNKQARNCLEYKIWRRAVFERDNFTCQHCGIKGCYLHADHIKPFALFPELRLAIDNGRTLCVKCHRKTDTFAGKSYHKKPVN